MARRARWIGCGAVLGTLGTIAIEYLLVARAVIRRM